MTASLRNALKDPTTEKLFPNIRSLVSSPQKQAVVDVVQFFQHQEPVFGKGFDTSQLSAALNESASATLFIVENVNAEFIDFLCHHVRNASGESFNLQCLESFLDASPIYVYDDVEPQLCTPQSVALSQQHLNLQSVSAREFDYHFWLKEESLDDKEYWPNGRIGGLLYPIQRRDKVANGSPLPPVVIIEQRFTAWFDASVSETWTTGLILVDRPFRGRGLPGFRPLRLTPSATASICTLKSHRVNLTTCIEQNDSLPVVGVPAPFIVLQDTYRLVVAEYMAMVTYFARDLNTIQWSLEGRTGSDWTTPEEFEDVLKRLYTIRRRLTRYRMLVGQQLESCSKYGQAAWNNASPSGSLSVSPGIAKASADLQLNFAQALDLIERNLDLAEHSIKLLTSLMSILQGRIGIEENKRNIAQNKLLMMLTFVATFFLPVNAISSILNMQGDWAPLQPNFAIFWAIALPISIALVILLICFRFFV